MRNYLLKSLAPICLLLSLFCHVAISGERPEIHYFPGDNQENIDTLKQRHRALGAEYDVHNQAKLQEEIQNISSPQELEQLFMRQVFAGNLDFLEHPKANFEVRKSLRLEFQEYFLSCDELFFQNLSKISTKLTDIFQLDNQEKKAKTLFGFLLGVRAITFAHAASLVSNSKCLYLFEGKHSIRAFANHERLWPLTLGLGNCTEIAIMIYDFYPELKSAMSTISDQESAHVYNFLKYDDFMLIIDGFASDIIIVELKPDTYAVECPDLSWHYRGTVRNFNCDGDLPREAENIEDCYGLSLYIGDEETNIKILMDEFSKNMTSQKRFNIMTVEEKNAFIDFFYFHLLMRAEQVELSLSNSSELNLPHMLIVRSNIIAPMVFSLLRALGVNNNNFGAAEVKDNLVSIADLDRAHYYWLLNALHKLAVNGITIIMDDSINICASLEEIQDIIISKDIIISLEERASLFYYSSMIRLNGTKL